ncbi:60Kd inner membrane protein [Rhizoctonia solani]|uniref:60Kd inner membrane protein n=1 Tax=Rhizoctonia solani TaxID=456999 RepID=A0A8H7ID72_9AGAM|nr:60Kd inner membrane protein [Rhizoctonia solani]
MLLLRATRQTGLRGTLPLSRKLSIAAASQGFARPAYRLGTNPTLGPTTPAPTQPSPDTTTPEPVESVAGIDAPVSPPIEVTQAEPNIISPMSPRAPSMPSHLLQQRTNWATLRPTGLEEPGRPDGSKPHSSFFTFKPAYLGGLRSSFSQPSFAPQLAVLTDQIKRARDAGDSAALQHAGFRAQKLLESAGANPFKGLLGPLVQMPVALSFFFGIRNVCNAGLPTLKEGGIGWFTDLTVADPTWALPILSSASMLILLETSAIDAQAGAAGHTRNFFRVLSLITIPIVSYLPAGVLVYFVANGVFMLIQNALVKVPSIRKRYNIVDKPAPPPGAKVTTAPTFTDSLRALRDGVKDAARKAREQQEAEARARARANPGKRN